MPEDRVEKAKRALHSYWNSRGNPEVATVAMSDETGFEIGARLPALEAALIPMERGARSRLAARLTELASQEAQVDRHAVHATKLQLIRARGDERRQTAAVGQAW